MSSVPADIFFWVYPPTASGIDDNHKVLSTATSSAAANYDWVTALGTAAPPGTVMLTLEATTQDCWVRFKPTTSAAGTTTTNGLIIKAGQPGRSFYVNPAKHGVIDVIAAGVGSLQVQVSSPVGIRNTI
jgi:hypothetical protein